MTLTNEEDLQVTIDQTNILRRITNRIRRSVELQDILNVAIAEVRSFLRTDRVMIYEFHPDGSGQVIAESTDVKKLPSLVGLFFPAEDVPSETRQMYIKTRVRTVINVDTQEMGLSPICDFVTGDIIYENLSYRPVDPCHAEYLTAMGVKSSIVAPILHHEELWGLLVSHHSIPRQVTEDEIDAMQMVVDMLSVAIAQNFLLTQARERASRETILNRITNQLNSVQKINLQPALEAAVTAFGGSGGRLCMRTEACNFNVDTPKSFVECLRAGSEHFKLYTYGKQPLMPEVAKYPHIEQYSAWETYYQAGNYYVWAISDIYKVPALRNLQVAFKVANIRSMLMIPLHYRQQLLGYLSIFRDVDDIQPVWSGEKDPDPRQLYTRLSFEIWRESKKAQAPEWTADEIELAGELSKQFATAIYEYELYQQVHRFNTSLETQVQERTAKLQQASEQQQLQLEVVVKMRQSLDLNTIFKTTTRELRRVLNADRVGVYYFYPTSNFNEGEFIAEDVESGLLSALAIKVNDHCFGEIYAEKYYYGQVHVVADISKAGLQECHVETLEKFQTKAQIITPLLKGDILWGLLCIHQCKQPREWQTSEVQFAVQIANQLGVAISQADLLAQTQEQAADLRSLAEQQQALFGVVTKIRHSLDVETIFQTATKEVCQALQTDRVAVYCFHPDWSGEFVEDFEFTTPRWGSFVKMGIKTLWDDIYLQQMQSQQIQGEGYFNYKTLAVDDINQHTDTKAHLETLEEFHIKAYVIAPIFIGEKLWGLLGAYQHSEARRWEVSEIKFLSQTATQLGVALQQAELLTQTRQQAEQLAQALEELKQTQTQLIQTEKMSSLGQLVAGVAHEINNPVNFITGNINHAREYTQSILDILSLYKQHNLSSNFEIQQRAKEIDLEFIVEDLPRILSSMQMGADRIQEIVLSLRNFSRLDQAEMKSVDIHEGINSTLLILQHRLKPSGRNPGIEVIKYYGHLPSIECYAGQLNQVFMNILSNAIDSLEESFESGLIQHPQIIIHTEETSTQDGIAIRIVDNGLGISEEMKEKVFDPFFTTKTVGKGTGLGLSISYQIVVEKHRGVLKCNSQPEGGTEFYIEIPSQYNLEFSEN